MSLHLLLAKARLQIAFPLIKAPPRHRTPPQGRSHSPASTTKAPGIVTDTNLVANASQPRKKHRQTPAQVLPLVVRRAVEHERPRPVKCRHGQHHKPCAQQCRLLAPEPEPAVRPSSPPQPFQTIGPSSSKAPRPASWPSSPDEACWAFRAPHCLAFRAK